MAFEYRRMSDEDMALYESWDIVEPISCYVRDWVVDEGNDIYFICFGGRGDHPDPSNYHPTYFLLRYKGLNVFFEGREALETIIEGERWRTTWTIEINLPCQIKDKVSYLMHLIEDALLCKKSARKPGLVGKIEIRVIVDNVKVED